MKTNAKILTDSTADLPEDFIRFLDIEVVPMNLVLDGKVYRDGIDIRPGDIYRSFEELGKMRSKPARYEDYALLYKRLVRDNEQLFIIHLSSRLSETYDIACQVHGDFKHSHNCQVEIVDSRSCSMGLGLLVIEAAKLAIQGMPVSRIKEEILEKSAGVSVYFSVPDLKYLRRGKKIGGLKSLLGMALKVHPILAIDKEGKLAVVGKLFGKRRNFLLEMMEHIQENIGDRAIDLAVAHANTPIYGEELKKAFAEKFDCKKIYFTEVGPSIGINTGPGTTGIMYIKKEGI
jgi:DegV family protein with EDD domain